MKVYLHTNKELVEEGLDVFPSRKHIDGFLDYFVDVAPSLGLVECVKIEPDALTGIPCEARDLMEDILEECGYGDVPVEFESVKEYEEFMKTWTPRRIGRYLEGPPEPPIPSPTQL